jgi:hypothetical protein
MKKSNLWLGILAITLVFAMAAVGCDDGSTDDGGGSYTADSIEAFAGWIVKQPINTASAPYKVKLKVDNSSNFAYLRDILKKSGKYVYLDLSGSSALTGIPDIAFLDCTSLTSVTMPNNVTSKRNKSTKYNPSNEIMP